VGEKSRYQHKGQEILELMRELRDMPERRVVDEWQSLEVSIYVYDEDYRAIREFADSFTNDPENQDIWEQQSINKARHFHLETSRLLQNHVAAVEALLEHTDKIHERLYRSHNLIPDYLTHVSEFRKDPLVSFVRALRNIVLHGETAKTMFQSSMSGERWVNRMGLPLNFLKKHRTWLHGSSQQYLVGKTDFVEIPALLRDHDAKVKEFVTWFAQQMQTASARDFLEFASRERELFLLQVEDGLDGWLANPNPEVNPPPGDFGLFHGLFDRSEFESLDRLPRGSIARAELAIGLLEARYPVPAALKNKILRAYTDANFFRCEMMVPRTTEERTRETAE
jgi:hypothetical protein